MKNVKAGVGRTASLIALTLMLVVGCAAQTNVANQELAARVDEYVNGLVKQNRFSGAILLAREGKVLLSKGYGMANLEDETPNTPQTKFRLGSLTKQFTAAAILLLQERGKLSVQDSICKHVENCPAKFIVDGNWITDPANSTTEADGQGNINSVLVKGSDK